jgi:hypothetical protein
LKLNNLPVVTVTSKNDGLDALKLTEEPFAGIIYTYGKVSFEEGDALKINFDYSVVDYADKVITDAKPFEKYIGDILVELIHRGIEKNNLTYTGGIDENRNKDSEQSDT